MKRMMVDVKTLDTTHRSAIISIGAVVFDEDGILERENMHHVVEINLKKYDVSWGSIRWWMGQNDGARSVFTDRREATPLNQSLSLLKYMYKVNKCEEVWSHGAAFDVPILENAFRKEKLKTPWKYSQVRCTRTVFNLAGVWPINSGTLHNALDDAVSQTEALLSSLKKLNLITDPRVAEVAS